MFSRNMHYTKIKVARGISRNVALLNTFSLEMPNLLYNQQTRQDKRILHVLTSLRRQKSQSSSYQFNMKHFCITYIKGVLVNIYWFTLVRQFNKYLFFHFINLNIIILTVCSGHVTYTFESESTLYSCLNVKELLAWSRREIWGWSDCNWTRTQNHLVLKRTLSTI